MVRNNTASHRTDLLPWALARDALWAPVVGACVVVLAPPADHPVFASRAATGTGPPTRQRRWLQFATSILRWIDARRAHASARERETAHASAQ
jgi:hypothetical protein